MIFISRIFKGEFYTVDSFGTLLSLSNCHRVADPLTNLRSSVNKRVDNNDDDEKEGEKSVRKSSRTVVGSTNSQSITAH